MRICILPPDQKEPHQYHITSGQERVARDQGTALAALGHDVDYWTVDTPNNLTGFGFTHKKLVGVNHRAFYTPTDGSNFRPKGQSSEKRKWCEQHHNDYDLFLCHVDSGVFLKELVRVGVGHKIISFIHCHFAGTLWGIGFNSGQGRVRAAGGTVVAVSERAQRHWNKWSAGILNRFRDGTMRITRPDQLNERVVFDQFVTETFLPQYSTLTDDVKEPELGAIVVSRIAEAKKVHIAFGLGATFVLRSDEEKYYKKIKEDLVHEEHYIDLPHAECMTLLGVASVLISTWTEEASPLAVFEAAERGVPAIICEKGERAGAREYMPEWAYIVAEDTAEGVSKAIDSIPDEWYTMEFRQRLAEHMRLTYQYVNYQHRLSQLVERVYERVKDLPVTPVTWVERYVKPGLSDPIFDYIQEEAKLGAIMHQTSHGTTKEVCYHIPELTALAKEHAKHLNHKYFDNETGIYLILLHTANKEKPRLHIETGDQVDVMVSALKLPRLEGVELPENVGMPREWSKWQFLWNAGTHTLNEGIVPFINTVVGICSEPIKQAILDSYDVRV